MGSISKPLDRSNIIVLGESILPSPVAARLLIFMGTLGLLGLFVLGPHSSMWNLSSQLYVCAQLYLFVTPQTVVCQASLFIEFSRQEYWSGLPFPSPGDLPDPEIEPESPTLAGRFFTSEPPGKQILYQLS